MCIVAFSTDSYAGKLNAKSAMFESAHLSNDKK